MFTAFEKGGQNYVLPFYYAINIDGLLLHRKLFGGSRGPDVMNIIIAGRTSSPSVFLQKSLVAPHARYASLKCPILPIRRFTWARP
jgi:hypothetical protein